MTGFLISAIIMSNLIVLIWLSVKAIEGSRLALVGVCSIVFLLFGMLFNYAIKIEAKGPCHKYETQLMYNAATKTMMPSRVCVLRGEWGDDDDA